MESHAGKNEAIKIMSRGTRKHLVINSMPQRLGGGLTIMTGLVDAFAKQNDVDLEITVVCSADETREAFERQGVADVVLQPLKNASQLKRFLWTNFSFGKFVKELDADLYFAFNQYTPGIPCPQIVFHTNLLHFMPIASGTPLKQRLGDTLRNRASKQALKKADVNVFESKYLRQCGEAIFKQAGKDNPVIYHGLPDSLTAATPDKKLVPVRDGQIISITNYNPHKDNTTLLRMLAELKNREPEIDWQLKIAGGNVAERWQPYRSLAQELGISENVQWLGFMQQDQLSQILKESMCLVSTSQVESFCLVGIEAMARGCPAIVANCTSMPESIEEAGVLVEPGSAEQFADAVLELRSDAPRRQKIIEQGFQRIRDLNWETCGRQFGALFKKTLQDKLSR